MTADASGTPRFPVRVDVSLLLGTMLLATGVGLIAAIIPARRAARLDPAAAIHGD
jgi:lipoprotein-releasing system permease protein